MPQLLQEIDSSWKFWVSSDDELHRRGAEFVCPFGYKEKNSFNLSLCVLCVSAVKPEFVTHHLHYYIIRAL
jgi:hypothetical protein